MFIAGCGEAAEKGSHASGVGGSSTASGTLTTGAVDGAVGTQASTTASATVSGTGGGGGVGVRGSSTASAGGAAGEGGGGGNGSGDGADVPGFDDLIIRSSVMHDYEGLTVAVAYDHNITADSRSDNRYAVIRSGAFEVSWRQGFDRDTFGAYAFLYVDVNDNASCSQDVDPVWWFFANNFLGDGEPEIAEFDPGPDSRNVDLQEIDCETFEAGL
jgi:hypothetical protein